MTKRVIVLRGLPGSGKSSLARRIAAASPSPSAILSTDDWFIVAGEYRFDPTRLGAAHEWNKWRFAQALSMGIPLIIVDNTNVLLEHLQPYEDAAMTAGYSVERVTVETALTDEELAARNTHGVPISVITAMRCKFEKEVDKPSL